MARLWILGASDPEMTAIEAVLNATGEKVAYATLLGQRVNPGTAYKADGQTSDSLEGLEEVVLVECELPGFFAGDPAPRVSHADHHRPGDPGYGKGPEKFLEASSIGQVISLLGVVWAQHECGHQQYEEEHHGSHKHGCPPAYAGDSWCNQWMDSKASPEHLLIAAADHCLSHAYNGECPGVDPEALMAWRAASRAAFQNRTVEAVLADVAAARRALAEAPEVRIAGAIKDLRGKSVPELPEAAARDGIAFISTVKERDGREKVVLQAGAPDQIEAFMKYWAPEEGLTGIYGDPARGFCGGYRD